MSLYVLDTNIFIQAYKDTYPIDVAAGFWIALKKLAHEGKIISIDKVKAEIDRNEDDLKEWIKVNLPVEFFKKTDEKEVLSNYGLMAPWAESRSSHYQRGAINEFLEFDNADAWLVAWCITSGDILVTQEVSKPGQKNRIPIPQVCQHFQVSYCSMIDMFRSLHIQF